MKTTNVNLSQYDRNLQDWKRQAFKTTARSIVSLMPSPQYRQSKPQKRFVIFGQGRTGSTLLVELLKSHPDIRCDSEILHDWKWFPDRHVLNKMATCKKQAYGFKLLSYQLDTVLRFSQPDRFIHWLLDQDFRLIYLRRDNLLKHAISQIHARIKQKFAVRQQEADDRATKKIHIERDELFWWLTTLERRQQYETNLLQNTDRLSLVYETDLSDAENWSNALTRVFNYLDLPPAIPETTLIKVTPEKLADIVSNYDELVKMLQDTDYWKFLDERA